MLKNRISLLLALFLVLTLGVSIASALKPDVEYSFMENRTMAYFAGPRIPGIWSGEYFSDYETYCLDQVVGRDQMILANSRIQRMLGKKEFNNVCIGRDGCLLDVRRELTDAKAQEIMASAEDAINAQLDTLNLVKSYTDTYGGHLYYVDIYPRSDYFAGMYSFPQDGYTKLDDNIRNMRIDAYKKAGFNTVDASDDFCSRPDEKLYYYTDCHYSFKGAYYLYQKFLEELRNNGNVDLEYPQWDDMTLVSYQEPFEGSYMHMIGDQSFEYNDRLEYAIPDDYPTTYDRYESGEPSVEPIFRDLRDDGFTEYNFMDGIKANTIIDTHRDDLPSILVLGNSFSQAFETLSVYDFGVVHGINPNLYDGSICAYIREHQPDYVVMLGDWLYDGNLRDGVSFHE